MSAIEFATSPDFLGASLYPMQGLLIKLIAAQPETLTAYDLDLLEELTAGYVLADDDGGIQRYVGSRGISPDVLSRIEWLRERGAPGFGEVVLVAGRRFGKSFLAAISTLYRVWQLMMLGDVHQAFGVVESKLLVIPVMSGSHARARRDQFGDILNLIAHAPCFEPYLVATTAGSIQLTTPAGCSKARPGATPKVLIEIVAVETTTLSVRGPAVPVSVNDEVAHLIGAGSTASFDDIHASVKPATVQFRVYALIWSGSSPETKEGKFYDLHRRALTVDADGGPAEPSMLTVQLESWAAYRDWESAHEIPMWPGGPCYARQTGPILAFNDKLRQEEHDNPSTFAVEYRGQWAEVLDAYLPADLVNDLFAPFDGRILVNHQPPDHSFRYVAHADPSVSQAGFGFALGHLETVNNVEQVFFDVLHAWNPHDFTDGRVDYVEIADELFDIAARYRLAVLTFDQFNSAEMIQRLQKRFRDAGLPTRVSESRENHRDNWINAEAFKTRLGQRTAHAPRHALAEAELRSLQVRGLQRVGAPRSGPITTCDIPDCMIGVLRDLTSEAKSADIFERLSKLRLRGSKMDGMPPRPHRYRPGGSPC